MDTRYQAIRSLGIHAIAFLLGSQVECSAITFGDMWTVVDHGAFAFIISSLRRRERLLNV